MKTIIPLKQRVGASDNRSDRDWEGTRRQYKKVFLKRREGANEATLLSNAKPLVFYLGLNYSTRKQPPPSKERVDIGLYITFPTGE